MKSINRSLRLLIAGVSCELVLDNDDELRKYFKKRFFIHDRSPKSKIRIVIKRETTRYIMISSPLKVMAEFPLTTIKEGINSVLTAFLEFNLIDRGIILLHASGFERKGSAFLFPGRSGSGKTTVLTNAPTANRIADDVAVIRKVRGNHLVYYSTLDFGRIKRKPTNKPALLKKIFILKKSKKIETKPVSFRDFFSMILNNDYLGMAGLLNQRSKKEDKITIDNFREYKRLINKHNRNLINLYSSVKIKKLFFPKKFNWLDIK